MLFGITTNPPEKLPDSDDYTAECEIFGIQCDRCGEKWTETPPLKTAREAGWLVEQGVACHFCPACLQRKTPLVIGGEDSGKVRSWRECPHNLILGTPGSGIVFNAKKELEEVHPMYTKVPVRTALDEVSPLVSNPNSLILGTPGAGRAYHVHKLKLQNPFFEDVVNGRKVFEVRKNDRYFQQGDLVFLQEYHPESGYTGRECRVIIDYIVTDFPGSPEGWCYFSWRGIDQLMENDLGIQPQKEG